MNNWSAAGIGLIVGAGVGWLVAGHLAGGDGARAPTTQASAVQAGAARETVESFYLEFPADGVALTNNGNMFLKPFPDGISRFEAPSLNTSMGLLAKVRDAAGEIVGFTSELEVFPNDMAETFMTGKAVWDTVWTLVIPGRGALFLAQQEHSGTFASDIMGPALAKRESWTGAHDMTTTVGPGADGRGQIVGGNGEFEGAHGAFIERNHFTAFKPDGGLRLTTELRLFFTARPGAGKSEDGS